MDQLKTPYGDGLNRFASGKFQDLSQLMGKALPASVVSVDETNTIVTVKIEIQSTQQFPQITCPVGTSQYARLPIQQGDLGGLVAFDYYMGGMSGLGGGVATLAQLPNMSTLVWFPVGNKDFTPLREEEQDKPLISGPQGVYLKSIGNGIEFNLDKDAGLQITWNGAPLMTFAQNGVSIQYMGHGIVINNAGTFIDGKQFLPHEHTGVQPGSGNSGPVS